MQRRGCQTSRVVDPYVPESWPENPRPIGQPEHRGGRTGFRRRTRLPGDALIVLDVGLGLTVQVPIRHRLGCIVPAGRPV